MSKANEFYTPDYQQAHEHHMELLKKSNQDKLALQATATPNRKLSFSHGWEHLRHWFSGNRYAKMSHAASRSSDSRM